MRRFIALLLCALVIPIAARAQVKPNGVLGPSTYTFSGAGQSNVWACNSGQGSFQLAVPAGVSGTFTVTVAQTSAGPFVNPPMAFTAGSAAYTNTLTNSGALTVSLASNLYVQVALTSYTSGSVTVTGTCSSAGVAPPAATSVAVTQGDGTQLHATIDALPALPAGTNSIGTVNLGTGSGQNSTGTGAFLPVCDMSADINISAAGTTQLVAAPGSGAIHVCHVDFLANGQTAVTFQSGTGTNCGTGTANIAGPYPLTGQTGMAPGSGIGVLWSAPPGNALCLANSAAFAVGGVLTYGEW